MLDEIRYAWRVLRAHPMFAITVIAITALAIGANTAVFALVNAVLVSPLPFRDPHRLVAVTGLRPGTDQDPISLPDFRDLRDQAHAFETLAAVFQWSANVTGGEAERLQGMRATASLFPMLGTGAARGRALVPDDERGSGQRVVVLTHGLWTRRYGADAAVIGTTMLLNGDAYRIVGVMPPAFVTPVRDAEIIAPFPMETDARRTARDMGFLRVLGRLHPGTDPGQATRDLDAIVARLRVEYPSTNATHLGVKVIEWQRTLVARSRPLLLLVQAAVGLVLVAACANLANLFLASALRRAPEFAVRSALGASRPRLIREVLIESAMLAAAGGAIGVGLAALAGPALLAGTPPDLIALAALSGHTSIDWRVLGVASGATAVAALAFAAVPAWRLAAGGLDRPLGSGARTSGPQGGRTARRWLVTIEVALASALLTLTVVLTQSFARLQSVDPGFRPDHLLTMRLSVPKNKYGGRAGVVRFVDELRPALLAIPGVADASAVNVVPLNGYRATADFWPADRAAPAAGERPEAHYRMVGTTYFATFGVPILEGRALDAHDTAESEAVVLVNRALAQRFWRDRSPVGESLLLVDSGDDTVRRARIVGVTGDVKHFGLDAESTPDVYVAIAQVPEGTIQWLMNNMYWGIKTTVAPESLRDAARGAVRKIDPDVPASALRTMEEALALAAAPRVLNLRLVRIFAAAALVLAIAGIYAVTAFGVAQRTREIGIRAALGAQPGQTVRLVVLDAARPIAIGLLAGAVTSIAAAPALRTALFDVNPLAPGSIAVVSALLLGAGVSAAIVAAWRLRSIDPIVALRAE